MDKPQIQVRRATVEDAAQLGRLLRDFNLEFDEPTPAAETIAGTVRRLHEAREIEGLLAGEGPDGFALLRFRPALWSEGAEAYLQELYVVPSLRGQGIGKRLLEESLALARERGADTIDLNTGETDTAARGLYESMGFSNREGGPDGPSMLYYEREV